MREILATGLVATVALFGLVDSTAGQYAPGDVVVTDQQILSSTLASPLWGITPQGTLYTVTTSLPFAAWAITPAPDNRGLWISGAGPRGYVTAKIARDGTLTTLESSLWHYYCSLDMDSGRVLAANRINPYLHEYASGMFTTLYSGAPLRRLSGGGFDLASGDFVVLDELNRAIYRLDIRGRPTATTLLTGVTAPQFGVAFHADPGSGTLVGSWNSAVHRLAVGGTPRLTTLIAGAPFTNAGALDRDPRTGEFVIPNVSYTVNVPSAVFRFDARTRSVTTFTTLPATLACRPIAVAVAGSRHLCASGGARPGQPYTLLVSSPREPGAYYLAAISFGTRPGLAIGGGRKVDLATDGLFFYSLSNSGIFSGFQGVLNPAGEGFATVRIPNVPGLSGTRFFAAAITIKDFRVSVIAETIGVTIQ